MNYWKNVSKEEPFVYLKKPESVNKNVKKGDFTSFFYTFQN